MTYTNTLPSTPRFALVGPDGSDAMIGELDAVRTAYRQGFVLSWHDRAAGTLGEGRSFVFVLNPSRYTLTEPFQATLTPHEGNGVIAEEHGVITRDVILEGHFGLEKKRAQSWRGAQGNGEALSGTQHFNELRRFLRSYSEAKKDPAAAANIELVLHVLRDDDHFVVVPKALETPRDSGTSRVHYPYRLTLTAVRVASEADRFGAADSFAGLDAFTKALDTINEAFNSARAAVAEVTATLSEIKRKVGNITAVVDNAVQLVNAVAGFVNGTADLIDMPLQLAANITESVGTAADTLETSVANLAFGPFHEGARNLRRMEAAFDRICMFGDRFESGAKGVEDLFAGERSATNADLEAASNRGSTTAGDDDTGGTTIGSALRATSGSGRYAGLAIPRGTALAEVTVRASDSIESIAAAANTTPEAIIVINDLRAPYFAPGGGPGLLAPGSIVLAPTYQPNTANQPRGVVGFLTPQEALYGIDIAIDRDRLEVDGVFDIRVDETQGGADFELARGIDNVVQGTEITVGTEYGTTLFLPYFGLRAAPGSRGTTQHVLLASIALREAVLRDTRVAGVRSSRVVFDSATGSLEQEISVDLKGYGGGATFILPVGQVSQGS